jgi:hypothetical protein
VLFGVETYARFFFVAAAGTGLQRLGSGIDPQGPQSLLDVRQCNFGPKGDVSMNMDFEGHVVHHDRLSNRF